MFNMKSFIENMPKAELHLHIEGTIQPTMLLDMAKRNGIELPYRTEEELMAAQDYGYPHLTNFLRHHYERVGVIRKGRDLYDITLAFLGMCQSENIRHVEIMFDPQVHLKQGLSFEEMIEGLQRACEEGARKYDVSSLLIMCANRDYPAEDALRMLDLAEPYRQYITGVGLDSEEKDNPPSKYLEFFQRARKEGYRLTAHCDVDQENSKENIRQCIHLLNVERIDHGVNCLEDPMLVEDIKARDIGLTVCQTWRISDLLPRRLKRTRQLLDLGLSVTINTDDPEEFASRYLSNTMIEVQKGSDYSAEEMVQFVRNAFLGSWLDDDQKRKYLEELELYVSNCGMVTA